MRRSFMGNAALTLAVLAFLGGGARADILVVSPSTQTNLEGDTNNGFPFNLSNVFLTAIRWQQVYASSEFTSVGSGMKIAGITFRPDANTGAAFSSTLPNVQIDLSTTSAAPGALNTNFNSNVGADDQIVTSGALVLSSSFTGPAGGPKNFDIHITFSTPFIYNPANGNLLLQVRNFGGGGTTQFDADTNNHGSGAGLLASRAFATDNNPNSTSGLADNLALITQFDFAPLATAPEPSSLVLASLGAAGLTLAGWRKRQRQQASNASRA
jgi:PEP-CTERM motif